jgi:hypothetical protein
MELWIRSQDKEKFLPIDKPIVYDFSEFGSHRIVYKESASYVMNLGTYNSKERALEILDMMQKLLTQRDCLLVTNKELTMDELETLYSNDMVVVNDPNTKIETFDYIVFEMPQE